MPPCSSKALHICNAGDRRHHLVHHLMLASNTAHTTCSIVEKDQSCSGSEDPQVSHIHHRASAWQLLQQENRSAVLSLQPLLLACGLVVPLVDWQAHYKYRYSCHVHCPIPAPSLQSTFKNDHKLPLLTPRRRHMPPLCSAQAAGLPSQSSRL